MIMSVVPLCALICAGIAAAVLQRRENAPQPCFALVTFVLPFAAGGFHGYTCAVSGILLLVFLLMKIRQERNLILHLNISFIAVFSVFLAGCLTPAWAADRGMAPFGILRWIPVLLNALYLMQCSVEERSGALSLVPLCGAVMTAASALLLLVPGMEPYVTVNGRLAGFFQYPNTFAAFLLAGLMIHLQSKRSHFLTVLLLTGIVLSGSRTVFVLLLIALTGTLLLERELKRVIPLGLALAAALLLGAVLAGSGILANADRYGEVTPTAGTFLVRLLYFKDALRLIVNHPFGLGYLGFRAVEGSIQTGRYYVTYVHNEFLQLLLDYGWIPGLLMAAAFLRSIFSKQLCAGNKLLLVLLLGHCMLDYDTEFLSIWILLLPLMDLSGGRKICISSGRWMAASAAGLMAVSLWLGGADLCYHRGNADGCLRLAPFHTDALAYQMSRTEDTEQAGKLADRILRNNPTHSIAWWVKSNEAFRRGEVTQMAQYQETAIHCNRYDIGTYCNYIDKLYAAVQICHQNGDTAGVSHCVKRIREVPALMAAVARETDALAYQTGDDPSMVLPEEYQALVTALAASGTG